MAKRKLDTATKKAAILAVAADVFSKRGYSVATIDDIAYAMGVTKGSIYYYFRKKSEILFALHEAIFDRFDLAGKEADIESIADPVERLTRAMHVHVSTLCADPLQSRVILGGLLNETTTLPPEQQQWLTSRIRAYELKFLSLIEAIPIEKRRGGLNTTLAAKCLLASMNSLAIWYRKPKTAASDGEIDSIVRQLLYGLLPHEPVNRLDLQPQLVVKS